MMRTPDRREDLGVFLNREGLKGIAVEVGCAFGGFTKQVIQHWGGMFYYMVDPWTDQDPEIYKERQEEPWKYQHWFKEAVELSQKDHRVRPLRLYSVDAMRYFDNESLDCVYIDGNHDFKHSYEDIVGWYPKVKPGGLLGGHDCYNSTENGNYCQVKDAVDRWFKETGNAVVMTDCSSWWHRKPHQTLYMPTSDEVERMAQ